MGDCPPKLNLDGFAEPVLSLGAFVLSQGLFASVEELVISILKLSCCF